MLAFSFLIILSAELIFLKHYFIWYARNAASLSETCTCWGETRAFLSERVTNKRTRTVKLTNPIFKIEKRRRFFPYSLILNRPYWLFDLFEQ